MKPAKLVLRVPAVLHLDGWAGRRAYSIVITGETREYYRFEAQEPIPMPGRRRLAPGDHGRAPKGAVTLPLLG